LVERGVEVHVLTRHYPGLRRYELISGVEVHRVGEAGLPRGLRAASYLAGALAAMHRLRDRLHVLHAHQLYAPAAVGILGRAMPGRGYRTRRSCASSAAARTRRAFERRRTACATSD